MMPYIFPIRHLSPSGAWHLRGFLERIQPTAVLIEGPSDANDQLDAICLPKVKPPIALLAYTTSLPVQTILYPFADYSPEYQAIKWAKKKGREVRFIDLPTSVFLGFQNLPQVEEPIVEDTPSVYEQIYKASGEIDYDSYWERHFEHNLQEDAYREGMLAFGKALREVAERDCLEDARHVVREAYMKAQIQAAIKDGHKPEKIVVVVGAYHASALEDEGKLPLTKEEMKALPSAPSKLTLMPYSYYRLSSRSGYGAGNKAPYYFELMWRCMLEGKIEKVPYLYMTRIADYMRKNGHIKSSAETIEAVRLSLALTKLYGGSQPTLRDLRDGATTCLGQGEFSAVAKGIADIEIGTRIGRLPEGVSQTAIQHNFYALLKDLKLEKYRTPVSNELQLDLRENRRAKTEKTAFLDLNRSFFLHRLQVMGVSFAKKIQMSQDKGTWAEGWHLCWTPEAEIEMVEAALCGDTVEMAAAYVLKEKLDKCTRLHEVAAIIQSSYECGLEKLMAYAVSVLQGLAVEQVALDEVAKAASHMSTIIRFGSIRQIDVGCLVPILSQLFLRGSYILVDAALCNAEVAARMTEALEQLHAIANYHSEDVAEDVFVAELQRLSDLDNRNPRLSGVACSILLERAVMGQESLQKEIGRRLSPGIPPDIGAGWFEGLASHNRYVLLGNLEVWKALDNYIEALDQEAFKGALVFLHRAFSTFGASEKQLIAENLANLWGLDEDNVSDYLNRDLSEDEEAMLEDLQQFDFGDF